MPRHCPPRTNHRLRPLLAAALLMALSANTVLAAEPPSPETRRAAKQYYDQATRHYDAGRYGEAIVGYEAAYRLTALPELLYNIGQACRLKGDRAEAISHYRRYLEAQPKGRFASTAKEHIAALEKAEQRADRRPPHIESKPPSPTVTPPTPERPVAVPLVPQAAPSPSPSGDSASPKSRRWVPWVAGAAAAVVVIAGVVVGVVLAQPKSAPDCSDCTDGLVHF